MLKISDTKVNRIKISKIFPVCEFTGKSENAPGT